MTSIADRSVRWFRIADDTIVSATLSFVNATWVDATTGEELPDYDPTANPVRHNRRWFFADRDVDWSFPRNPCSGYLRIDASYDDRDPAWFRRTGVFINAKDQGG